jgi:hypothetical protein
MNETKRRFFSFRGFTSFLVTLSFLVTTFSGGVLFAAPRGRDADWVGWSVLGLRRDQWLAVHIPVCVLFVVFAVIHLVYNWPVFWGYIRLKAHLGIRRWKELALAAAVVGFVVAGTLWQWPPMNDLMQWNREIKQRWSASLPRAPFGYAEELTLDDLARRAGVPVEDILASLRNKGLAAGRATETLADIAQRKSTSPAALFARLREDFPQLGDLRGRRSGWRGGREAP